MGLAVELHTRSAFSFLRGASLPEDLVTRAASLGYRSVGLIDHDGFYGSPRFERAAREAGITPIHGATVGVVDSARQLRGRLALLVTSRLGYQNLSMLVTLAKARVTKAEAREDLASVTLDELALHREGLLALLTAGDAPLASLAQRDLRPHREAVWRWAKAIVSVFGQRGTFVEVTRHHYRPEERRTQRLLHLAVSLKIEAVAAGDARYAAPDNAGLHDVFTCARVHSTIDAIGRRLQPSHDWYLHPPDEQVARFADIAHTLKSAEDLAARCAFTLDDLGYQFPEVPVPYGETPFSWLYKLTHKGMEERYKPITGRVLQQINTELQLIEKLGFAGYFLLVKDIIDFCAREKILVQGRGSAANSAVCYALRITAVDPIQMELLFERFLSEERGEWPDIDLDLPSGEQREKAIQYVYGRYGARGAAMTANVITYRARSAVREVGKALGFPDDTLGRVAKQVGYTWGFDAEWLTARLVASGLSASDARVGLWAKLSTEIQDLPRHLGQHSGGMVIAGGRLDRVVPLEPASMEGRVVIQWDKDDCAALGILKVDLLGLGMMALLEEVVETVNTFDLAEKGGSIDLAHLRQGDAKTYAMLQAADTIGVFQVESRAQMATLPRLKPACFYDLVIEVSLIRPGPIVGNMVHPYLARRAGRETVTYPHPKLEPHLKRTLGIPLFQEQLMKVAMVAADFSGGEAEALRRAMGSKRSHAKMDALKARLREGMTKNGYSEKAQDDVINGITSFAEYGFPESHAASFALLVYASAFIRAHHPASFAAALLNHWPMGFYHPATVVKDAQRHGVHFLPVDVTRSSWLCRREGPFAEEGVRLGLRYVKGFRRETADALVAAREGRAFASMDDFRRRVRPNPAEFSALAEVGAFATLDAQSPWSRREALWQIAAFSGQEGALLDRLDHPREVSPWAPMSLADRVGADLRVSGFSIGPHPLSFHRDELHRDGVVPIGQCLLARNHSPMRVAGVVITRQKPHTAKGFFFLTLEDETGILNAIVTPQLFDDQRAVFVGPRLLVLDGVVQRQDGVVNLKVVSAHALTDARADLLPESHDFH